MTPVPSAYLRKTFAHIIAAMFWRMLSLITIQFGAISFAFILLQMAPGDAAARVALDDPLRVQLATEWGLNSSIPLQILRYITGLIQGDLGTSWVIRPGMAVTELIVVPAGVSVLRALGAQLLCITIAVIGLAYHARLDSIWQARFRKLLTLTSLAPVFLLSHVLILMFNESAWYAISAKWMERPEWFALPDQPSMVRIVLAMVVLATASGSLAHAFEEIRFNFEQIRTAPFVIAMRARGDDPRPAIYRAMIPIIVRWGAAHIAVFIGGLVILEKVFLLPGIGNLLWQAALERDQHVMVGIVAILVSVVLFGQFMADMICMGLDPRARES